MDSKEQTKNNLLVFLLPEKLCFSNITLASTSVELEKEIKNVLKERVEKTWFYFMLFNKKNLPYFFNQSLEKKDYRTKSMYDLDSKLALGELLTSEEDVMALFYEEDDTQKDVITKKKKEKIKELNKLSILHAPNYQKSTNQSALVNFCKVENPSILSLSQSNGNNETLFEDAVYYKNYIAKLDIQVHRPKRDVTLYLKRDLHPKWIEYIIKSKDEIQLHAPRLRFIIDYEQLDEGEEKLGSNHKKKDFITIKGDNLLVTAYTRYHIYLEDKECSITLCDNWPDDDKQRTSTHEILHALGFAHEHQRLDGDDYFNYYIKGLDKKKKLQYLKKYYPITKVDPLSIMLYINSEFISQKRKCKETIMNLNLEKIKYSELSELDKLGLNLMHPACSYYDDYKPQLGETGLYYCGRKVMENHNKPAQSLTDGRCGPDNGPNCPACRVFNSPKSKILKTQGLFQGMSGMVYCGKEMKKKKEGQDGVCGPDNGKSCSKCINYIKY